MRLVSPHTLLFLATQALSFVSARVVPRATGPFLTQVDNQTWIIGNDVWNLTQEVTYGVKLYYQDHDCVGDAVGHYVSYNGAASNLNWSSAAVVANGTYNSTEYIDVAFTANEGDMHWVIFTGLTGAYQYFVNVALPQGLGEVRSLWRLDNTTFTHGRNNLKDEPLPPLSAYLPENKVQDETWLWPNGTTSTGNPEYITKYDFSVFVRQQAAYGVHGDGFGSWYINPGKDYYNGNHLKQELTVHRESSTGDAVQLNMFHGTHFMASSDDDIPVGKMWGPWLWYLNDGSLNDADARAALESAQWPYPWLDNSAYQARGTVTGTLTLSDGRPASYAAVFLGDNHPDKTSLDMGTDYYYTTYADADGTFTLELVRAGGSYGLQAWSNGSALADVTTTFLQNDVAVTAGETTALGTLDWAVSHNNKTKLFQVGDFDRYAYGFAHGGAPYQHALVANCPANLTYTVGTSATEDWCFGQTYQGNWTISFEIDDAAAASLNNKNSTASGDTHNATLIASIASYSTGTTANIIANDVHVIGNLTSGTEDLLNDPGLYRSATVAGEWRYIEFSFGADLLTSGWNNITFAVMRNTTWHGIMWDSIVLEW